MSYRSFLDDNERTLIALSIALKRLGTPLVITQEDIDKEVGTIVREDYDAAKNALTITRRERANAPSRLS